MIEKWLDPILKPFRDIRTSYLAKKNLVGNAKMDVKRVQNMGKRAKNNVDQANKFVGKVGGAAAPGAPGQPAQSAPQPVQPPPPPVKKGGGFMGLFGKKKSTCPQCQQQLDPSWDQCPYCMQAAQAAQAAAQSAKAAAPQKTQAFFIDQGFGAQPTLFGWLVALKGAQRGELFTLKPIVSVGTDASCDVVLNDPHMSRKHAEIKVQNGSFWLYDLGSTNGTFVNDKRVSEHELVDNDNLKFGQTPCKFKSL